MHRSSFAPAAAIACLISLTGCLERRVSIISEPAGATVTANDVELGRTPLEADFTHYGEYDVKVEKEGFEPLRILANASAPFYEYAPFDFIAMALPFTIEDTVPWKFTLTPALESTQTHEELNKGVIQRAHALRAKLPPDQ